jgi:DNA-binding response OmpR family regulator
MKSGHILVVDDQVALAENIAEILQGVGFETEIAASAEAGLARIDRGGITAVVTDYKLPGRSGAQLIEELRRRGERIPVLMMSAYTDEETIGKARDAGAWMFLPKPVPLAALVEAFTTLAEQPAATLVVDDEVGLADNLAEALRGSGHEVVVCHTASAALSQHRRVQTAVLDCRLPDGTGLDVARQLRARDPAIRLLFVSGFAEDFLDAIAREIPGAAAYAKPLDTGEVISWVQLALKRPERQ